MGKTSKLGTKIGELRFASILNFNSDGSILFALDDGAGSKPYNAPIPAAWTGPNGEFIGGYPETGASIVVGQGAGGKWFVIAYVNSNDVFDRTFVSANNNMMSALRPGRALIQTNNGNRIFADPKIGMQIGNAEEFVHIDPVRGIFSHNIDAEMSFTEAHRQVNQIIKRDVSDNSNRNILGSTLDSQSYDGQLKPICLDPIVSPSPITMGRLVRNPPLVESRKTVYEFAHSFKFTTDDDESNRYGDPKSGQMPPDISRRNMRADAFSLSLEHPNHLIESIEGTGVDLFGNILDLNRHPIPIGKEDRTSIKKSADKIDAFARIRALERKSIAYHWELNARKGDEKVDGKTLPNIASSTPPDPKITQNYGRSRSRLFVDIDKEGQFKINIPASSEVGNIPLLTRYENYSVVLGRGMTSDGEKMNPNEFAKNEEKREIFANDFANISAISLKATESDDEANVVPNDWIADDNSAIKFGTAHHDITAVCKDFTTKANWLVGGRGKAYDKSTDNVKLLVKDPINALNERVIQLDKIVSDTITVAGPDANGGGRSGVFNFDGFVAFNFGANTIDRQSLWIDTAGGIVSRIGRDRQNISYASTFDGDVFIEIGDCSIGNTHDSRFANCNDTFRAGTLDIRVLNDKGMSALFRIDALGIHLATPGNITMQAEQNITMKATGNILMEAETIMMYAETEKRIISRTPPGQTIG